MKRACIAVMYAALAWLTVSVGLTRAGAPGRPDVPDVVEPVNCAAFARPIAAYETSKGQSVFDVQSFLNDLVYEGFSVGTISGSIPSCVDVLIVRGVSGTLGLSWPYSAAEGAVLKGWVDAGHGLMLFGDWGAYRAGTEAVFAAFGFSQGGPGAVTDPNDFDPIGGTDWVIYQSDNFAAHPILEGITAVELLRSAWLTAPSGAIVTADANASPARVPVMAAIASGAGCAVLSTDSDWVGDSLPVSRAGYFKQHNARAARQAIAWLSSCGRGPTARPGGPYPVDEGSSVVLDGSASSDPAGDPLSFAWDLDNDGQFDDAFIVNPVYSAALRDDGAYPVSLRVSDGVYSDIGSTYVNVLNVAPRVTLTASATLVVAGMPITFSGGFNDPGILDTHTLHWNFGDGSQIFGLLARPHTFTAPGVYTVTLTVTDDDGGVGWAAVSVTAIPGTLQADAGGPYAVDEGSRITLSGSGSAGALSYAWDFDTDGQFDDAAGAAPTFSAARLDDGAYPIALRVSSGALTATASSTVTVLNVAPLVSLDASAWTLLIGQSVTFTGVFTDPGALDTHTVEWNPGDGSPPSLGSLLRTHIYASTGQFPVALTVTDDDGGVGQASRSIRVLSLQDLAYRAFLPLVARNFCVSTSKPADVVLTIDTSGSMQHPTHAGGPSKLDAAKTAAIEFLNLLVFPGDQAAVAWFNDAAGLAHRLSDNRAGLVAAVQSLMAGGVTRIDRAIAVSRDELNSPRHLPANSRVLILLTDGRPNGIDEAGVLAEANATKSQGITIFAIGLGGDVNSDLLRQVASTPGHYYFSPSTNELIAIYERIADALRCP